MNVIVLVVKTVPSHIPRYPIPSVVLISLHDKLNLMSEFNGIPCSELNVTVTVVPVRVIDLHASDALLP